jgi:hypothetical protein
MSSFYRLTDDPSVRHWFIGDPRTSAGRPLDPRPFSEPTPLRRKAVHLRILQAGPPAPFTFGPLDMPIVSRALGDKLLALCGPKAVRLIDAPIAGVDSNWCILQVLAAPDCIDLKASRPRRWRKADGIPEKVGQIASLEELVLNRAATEGALLFRPSGWPVELIATGEAAKLLAAVRRLGVRLERVRTSEAKRVPRPSPG